MPRLDGDLNEQGFSNMLMRFRVYTIVLGVARMVAGALRAWTSFRWHFRAKAPVRLTLVGRDAPETCQPQSWSDSCKGAMAI